MAVKVNLGGTTVKNIDTFSGQYEPVTVVLPPAAASPSDQLLEVQVTCANSTTNPIDCDRVDLDDVSLITGTPPAPPAITGTDPASPADNTTPKVRGTVGAGAPSEIRIYTSPTCAGSPAAIGSAADFTGAGIPVTVPDNSTSRSAPGRPTWRATPAARTRSPMWRRAGYRCSRGPRRAWAA